jgi:putative aldouronate transport system permease protein
MESRQFYTRKDKFVLWLGYTILGTFVLAILVPLIYVILASFIDPVVLTNQGISFNPDHWTLEGYRRVFQDDMIVRGFINSFVYSTVFAAFSTLVCLLAAYPMSIPQFVGRKVFNTLFVITMFFGGGLMPTYLLISNMGLIDSPLALILPGAVNVWNIILARTYYKSIPNELHEAAMLDGATDVQYFFQILIPLCKPIIMVLVLYQFVGMWNSYFDAMIYLEDPSLQPLQLVIRSILVQNTPRPGMVSDAQNAAMMAKIAEQLKYSTIVVSSLPLLIMYPFFQKYFEKGVMMGSVKG